MGLLPINGFDLTACLELNLMCVCFSCFVLCVICLASEKPDKELPGIVGARGDTV